ncbi:alpha/beta hydrolase [Rhodococcus sp. D2-41]|uniref:alpha/beta hydrolase n=1 Tax=Speluncibacter jeojiensis TaxID=2710754 RepID=UPI002410A53F|nr:alpha/beta hydrolase [Rhodococcus sp. D2-41]MDG3012573.1 alpha/beta hydrolase [Rhodococcus sp. D2-41]
MSARQAEGAVTVHETPSVPALLLYWPARLLLKTAYRLWPLGDRGIRVLTFIEVLFGWLPNPPNVDLTTVDLGGVEAELSVPRTSAHDQLRGVSVLYLHGGGFLFCGPATHRRVCARLAETLGVPVYSLRYRQLPEAGAGTSVQDACDAYRALLDRADAPDKVVVAGDSAGGFLAAKICELAATDGVPRPAAFVGYSPQLSLDPDRHDPALLKRDAYMPLSAIRRAKPRWERGPVALRGTRSPVDAPVEVFPPTFLTAADRELLEPDIRALTGRLHAAGRAVETHVWRRGVHAFPVLDALTSESRAAMRLTGEFLREVFGRTDTARLETVEVADDRAG